MRIFSGTAIAFGLMVAVAQGAAAQDRSTSYPTPGGEDPIANEGVVDDNAVEALKEMSDFLMTANTLGVTSIGSMDAVKLIDPTLADEKKTDETLSKIAVTAVNAQPA